MAESDAASIGSSGAPGRGPAPNFAAHIEELGKASRRSAALGGFGLAILLGSLAVAAWRLGNAEARVREADARAHRADVKAREVEAQIGQKLARLDELTTEVAKQQAALDSVRRDIHETTDALERTKRQLNEVQDVVARSNDNTLRREVQKIVPLRESPGVPARSQSAPPLERVSRVILAVQPTNRTVGNLPLYDIRFSVSVPPDRIGEVLKVEYFFDHPSFSPKVKTSLDASSGFAIKYYGWGCLDRVTVALVGQRGDRHELPALDMCASPAWQKRSGPAPH